jgi:Pyridoxamine 5'-phosphate oxidase
MALLATLRRSGWPRAGPAEAYVADRRLLIGVMARSARARDLARDPRCTLQSVVSAPNSGDPELKLYCRAVPGEGGPPGAWWSGRPAADVRVHALEIVGAALVSWDLAHAAMTVASWSPGRGFRRSSRPYP